VWEQERILERDPHRARLGWGILKGAVVQDHLASCERKQPGEGVDHRGLPGAVRSEERKGLTVIDRQSSLNGEGTSCGLEVGVQRHLSALP
jgi:hypothetical protein